MTEIAAQRLITSNPKQYQLVEPESIEFISLPPLQKKSVEVAAVEGNKEAPKSIGQDVPSNEVKAQPATTNKTTEQVLNKQK